MLPDRVRCDESTPLPAGGREKQGGPQTNGTCLMADVVLRNVIKRYGNYEAVRGISLEIPDTKFVALVGPSGCGKTTTLRMIAGLEDVSEGDICIGGRVINDVAPKNRDIAMVFQSYALYPHMTV